MSTKPAAAHQFRLAISADEKVAHWFDSAGMRHWREVRNAMDRDEVAGYAGLILLVAVVIGLAYAIFALVAFSVVVQSMALVLAAVGTIVLFQQASREASVRGKIATLFGLYVCFIFLFAGAYALAFFRTPHMAFRLSDDVLTEQIRSDLGSHAAAIAHENEMLAFLILMRSKADQIAVLTNRAVYEDVDVRISLSPKLSLHYRGDTNLVSVPEKPSIRGRVHVGDRFELDAPPQTLLCVGAGSLACTTDNKDARKLADRLGGAENADEIRAALDRYSGDAIQRIASHEAMALTILRRKPALEMSHFVFFSAAIMTTVGTGDIMPNTWQTRYLVVLQALFAVFFLGYALHIFWPDPKTGNRRGDPCQGPADPHSVRDRDQAR